jgi:hypothetical protein
MAYDMDVEASSSWVKAFNQLTKRDSEDLSPHSLKTLLIMPKAGEKERKRKRH